MNSKTILEKFLSFYGEKGHKLVPNVSLIPQNDPTLLYVNSGMFPLVPYLSGETHPLGKRIMNVQRCLRFFEDLENVGVTNRHTTAFHMLGNWSLGDYFKKEQLNWVYAFLIEELKLDPHRLYASVFEGDSNAPRDVESIQIIKDVFSHYGIDAKEGEKIFAYGKKENWWQRGDAIGELGGPDSEIYYYIGKDGFGEGRNPADFQDDFLEIGNSVFMQYKKTEKGWEELPQKNVDFGGGLERLALVVQNKRDIYETDNFYGIIQILETISGKSYLSDKDAVKPMRIVADHMRAASFLAMDGVIPSNKDQGYILRRLLRRVVRYGKVLGIEKNISTSLIPVVTDMFSWEYPELLDKNSTIVAEFEKEEIKFRKTLEKGAGEFKKNIDIIKMYAGKNDLIAMAQQSFDMFQSYGYPFEMFLNDVNDLGYNFGKNLEDKFIEVFSQHQEKSREGAEQKFKGGLADQNEKTISYHTATHLLNAALKEVLGVNIYQHGSNITGERLRFDFNYSRKLTEEEIDKVVKLVNQRITESLPVNFENLPKDIALQTGAVHAFNEKYGENVKVYYIGYSLENAVSKEFCGGPHVKNTSEIKPITIYKQEKIGDELVRIYAK